VAAVFGVIEHLARFGQDACGQRERAVDAAVFGQNLRLVPVFPLLERLAVDLCGKPDAVALLEVQPDHQDPRAPREVRPVFPECSVGGVVVLPDFDRFDGSVLSDSEVARVRALFRAPMSYSHPDG